MTSCYFCIKILGTPIKITQLVKDILNKKGDTSIVSYML